MQKWCQMRKVVHKLGSDCDVSPQEKCTHHSYFVCFSRIYPLKKSKIRLESLLVFCHNNSKRLLWAISLERKRLRLLINSHSRRLGQRRFDQVDALLARGRRIRKIKAVRLIIVCLVWYDNEQKGIPCVYLLQSVTLIHQHNTEKTSARCVIIWLHPLFVTFCKGFTLGSKKTKQIRYIDLNSTRNDC